MDITWDPLPEIVINAEIGLVKVPIRMSDVSISGRVLLSTD
jgi:hypothetical protein